ncbi:hypothetical protein QTP70_003692 [Hemibagrus guttatus]|uniref:Uncharacterized protein n=1 Tax=Hemibagrus guttatus TaxID=175788 RepID=A0AAE0PPN0_9TELE|nr:hypothetical protein QTP70_003692 [Hemibagrus guttatus]
MAVVVNPGLDRSGMKFVLTIRMVKFGNVLRWMPFLTQPSLFIRAWDWHRSHWTVTPMARLRGVSNPPILALEPSQRGEWVTTRRHSHKAKANAKACPREHHSSPLHMSNRFALLSEEPAEKPERALVIGDSILRHVKLARPLGAPAAQLRCILGARVPDIADDVVLLAPSSLDLQHALGHFAAECEAAGMRVSTSKSEAMVLDRKKVACTLLEGRSFLKWRSLSISGSCS